MKPNRFLIRETVGVIFWFRQEKPLRFRAGPARSRHQRRQARHLCRTITQTKFQPLLRSLIRFATVIYKDASPTGFQICRMKFRLLFASFSSVKVFAILGSSLEQFRHAPNTPVLSQDVRLTAKPDAFILHKIMSSSCHCTIRQGQAKLPRLIKEDSFAISVHGEVKGFYLSKQRLEAMIESIELLENPEFTAALKAHRSGRARTYTVKELDEKFSA